MAKCKFNNKLDCHIYDEPDEMCYYNDLEDCLCFSTGKYKSVKDLGDYVKIEFLAKHKHTHGIIKRLLLKIWGSQRA